MHAGGQRVHSLSLNTWMRIPSSVTMVNRGLASYAVLLPEWKEQLSTLVILTLAIVHWTTVLIDPDVTVVINIGD